MQFRIAFYLMLRRKNINAVHRSIFILKDRDRVNVNRDVRAKVHLFLTQEILHGCEVAGFDENDKTVNTAETGDDRG